MGQLTKTILPSSPLRILIATVTILVFHTMCFPVAGWADATNAPGAATGALAWRQLAHRDTESALSTARIAFARNGTDIEALMTLIGALHQLDRLKGIDSLCADRDLLVSNQALHLFALGLAARLRRGYVLAESLLTQSKTMFVTRGDSISAAFAGAQLATAILRQGRVGEAHQLYQHALRPLQSSGRSIAVVWLRKTLGLTFYYQRDLDSATTLLLGAAVQAHSLALYNWEGDALLTLSSIERERLDLDLALRHRQQALTAYRQAGDPLGQSRALQYIAVVHLLRGEYTDAMINLLGARRQAEVAQEPAQIGACLAELAGLYYRLGQLDEAMTTWREALKVGRAHQSSTWTAGVLGNLGLAMMDRKRHDEALEVMAEALQLAEQSGDPRRSVPFRSNLGSCRCELGQTVEGIIDLRAAAAAAHDMALPSDEIHALCDLGSCLLRLGDHQAAAAVADSAYVLASRLGSVGLTELALGLRSEVASASGAFLQAEADLRSALDLVESVWSRARGAPGIQSGYFAGAGNLYARIIDLQYQRAAGFAAEFDAHNLELVSETFGYMQRAKSRAFEELLTETEADFRPRASEAYQAREQEITEAMANLAALREGRSLPADSVRALEVKLLQLQQELQSVEAELRLQDPRYALIRYPQPISLRHFQEEILHDGELHLEYLLGDRASYLWAITAHDAAIYPLPDRNTIEAQLLELLPLLHDYNLAGDQCAYIADPLIELSRSLLNPILDWIAQTHHMSIAPDGMLYYLPFAVLVDDAEQTHSAQRYDQIPYLIKKVSLQYTPSVGVLTLQRSTPSLRRKDKPPAVSRELLLVGAPAHRRPEESGAFARLYGVGLQRPLPAVQEELEQVSASFGEASVFRLIGLQASEENLRRAGAQAYHRFVHIAAHGIYNERRPQFSGLVLSPDASNDGFLTVGEIYGLDLPCELVVLSACSSGLGELVDGEGLSGLTRAFLYAGADNVVAALWGVSGPATSILMGEFYRRSRHGGQGDHTQAMAEAMRRMIAGQLDSVGSGPDCAHPYFWSGFALTGRGR